MASGGSCRRRRGGRGDTHRPRGRRPHDRAQRRRRVPPSDRRLPRGRLDVREVPRRESDQRRRGGVTARQLDARPDRSGGRPLREVRAAGHARVWHRRQPRGRRARSAHPGHLLRDLPAGRLPALVLPGPERTRPPAASAGHAAGRAARRATALVHRDRAVAGAEPVGPPGRARCAGRSRDDRARPRLPTVVLARRSRCARRGARRARPGVRRGRQHRGVPGCGRRVRRRSGS